LNFAACAKWPSKYGELSFTMIARNSPCYPVEELGSSLLGLDCGYYQRTVNELRELLGDAFVPVAWRPPVAGAPPSMVDRLADMGPSFPL
jgi:hypothetical protein